MSKRSEWQNRVEGTWHGFPSMFDADGNHQGFVRVYRHLELDADNKPIFHVRNELQNDCDIAKLLARQPDLELSVADDGDSRVYVGRDIFGAGHPFGSTLIGNDYIHPWSIDTGVIVQLLPDGITQLYSCLAYQGPTIIGAILGRYRNVTQDDPETLDALETFLQQEQEKGNADISQALTQTGQWLGELDAYDANHQQLGKVQVSVAQTAIDDKSANITTSIEGPVSRKTQTLCRWEGNKCFYDGPDTWGNGIAYGRALFATQHTNGRANKIHSREVVLDEGLAVVWPIYQGGMLQYVLHGVLNWQ